MFEFVIPAQAGIHFLKYNKLILNWFIRIQWIPAYAGMTNWKDFWRLNNILQRSQAAWNHQAPLLPNPIQQSIARFRLMVHMAHPRFGMALIDCANNHTFLRRVRRAHRFKTPKAEAFAKHFFADEKCSNSSFRRRPESIKFWWINLKSIDWVLKHGFRPTPEWQPGKIFEG